MELLDFKYDLLISVVALDFPAAKIEIDDLLSLKAGLIEQIGEKHRYGSIGADEPDDSQLNDFGLLALPGAESLEEIVGGMEQDVVLLTSAAHEFLHSREGGLSRTAEEEIAIVVVSQRADEMIARVSTIKEQDSSRADGRDELEGLFALRAMNAGYGSGHGKASEHIIGRRDQTLGIVASAFVFETALRIELLSVLICCRKIVLGAIESKD